MRPCVRVLFDTRQVARAPSAQEMAALQLQLQLNAAGVRSIDVLQDAQRKGWRVMLNRRVAMHQSFLFQRDDRAAWVEIKSPSKNTLDIDYALVPVQDSSAQR
jgi:hypothetical protein